MTKPDLIERLCRSLAFHVVETELTLQFTDGDSSDARRATVAARALIDEAGFDFDELYPVDERPTAVSTQ